MDGIARPHSSFLDDLRMRQTKKAKNKKTKRLWQKLTRENVDSENDDDDDDDDDFDLVEL